MSHCLSYANSVSKLLVTPRTSKQHQTEIHKADILMFRDKACGLCDDV